MRFSTQASQLSDQVEAYVEHLARQAEKRDNDWFDQEASQVAWVLACFGLVVLPFSFFMVRNQVIRPIAHMTAAIEQVAQGNLKQRVAAQNVDELSRMEISFNQMTSELDRIHTGLQNEQDKLTTIIVAVQEGIVVTDRQGAVVLVNPAAERLLHKNAEQMTREGFLYLLDDPDYLRAHLERAGVDVSTVVEYNDRVLSVYANTIHTPDGVMVGSAAIFRDITEISRWQQQMELLLRYAPSAIALFDRELKYLQVSHRWLDDYNLQNRDIHGQSHWDLFPNLSVHWRTIFQRCLEGIWERNEADPILNEQFGTMQWIKWEAFPWRNGAGDVGGVVMHTEDITDRKLMENEVIKHRDRLAQEQRIVSTVIEKMQASHPFHAQNLRYLSIPVDQISGDMVLSISRPDGGQHIMVGDFTGHGIAAAISGPMVADIFCTMTGKGLDMAEIVSEINKKLCKQIPTSMFLAAAFLELTPDRTSLRAWNCAGPDLLVMRESQLHERIASSFLPRGILDLPEGMPKEVAVRPGDRIFVTTDGMTETRGGDGNQLGVDALREMLETMMAQDKPLEEVAARIKAFRDGGKQEDDLTLLEITC